MLIFELSQPGRMAHAQMPQQEIAATDIPQQFLRTTALRLPEVSELQVVRHYTCLSQKNFSIDTNFYPLGSCTMKYNPRGVQRLACLAGFLNLHPLTPAEHAQGFLSCGYEFQEMSMVSLL